jgi:hypothetical protein
MLNHDRFLAMLLRDPWVLPKLGALTGLDAYFSDGQSALLHIRDIKIGGPESDSVGLAEISKLSFSICLNQIV